MKKCKLPLLSILATLLVATGIFVGCKKDLKELPTLTSAAGGKKTALETPTLSCVDAKATPTSITLLVTAGGGIGAPAGFSVQWMLESEYLANGWPVTSEPDATHLSFCKASFSGVPGCSQYNLGAGQSVEVKIGDNLFDECGASSTCANTPLECNTKYVFRCFAHNDPVSGLGKSVFSATTTCSTAACNGGNDGCTYTQGYWKTHGPIPTGNNSNEWPVTGLTLGTVAYTDLELQSIFNTPPAGGNGLISLAHQLMAAKLNIANGADGTAVAGAIAAADALIGGLVVPPVGSGSLPSSATSSLTGTLTAFNEGTIGPGHCGSEVIVPE